MVLSYRHGFHAGNFADVVKHSIVSLILSHFHRKPTPFYFLDTHAGGALYNLRKDAAALKTLESAAGIGRVWHRTDYPAEMEPYLSAVRNLNGIYPGTQRSSIAAYAPEAAPRTATGATPAAERRRREYAWHHLMHSMGLSSTAPAAPAAAPSSAASSTAASPPSLPHFASKYPSAAFSSDSLELYPGSSLLAAYFQRQASIRSPGLTEVSSIADRGVATELHSKEAQGLKEFFATNTTNTGKEGKGNATAEATARDEDDAAASSHSQQQHHVLSQSTRSRIQVLHSSGFLALTSPNRNLFLAPSQGRGLVLIDPPFETVHESSELLIALPQAYLKFPQGVFAVWYPLIDYSANSPKKLDVVLWKQMLKRMKIPKMLAVELSMERALRARASGMTPEATAESNRTLPLLDDDASSASSQFQPSRQRGLGMTGTGLILINPPFGLEAQIDRLCAYLATVLPVPVHVEGQATPQIYPAAVRMEWLSPERIPKEETAQGCKEVTDMMGREKARNNTSFSTVGTSARKSKA